jgi:hypothetical protein
VTWGTHEPLGRDGSRCPRGPRQGRAEDTADVAVRLWRHVAAYARCEACAPWPANAAGPARLTVVHSYTRTPARHVPSGLDPSLELHHIVVNTWEGGVTAPQNVVLVSIPVRREGGGG